MKRMLYIFAACILLGAGACSNAPEDLFGVSASDRIEECLADYRFALQARGQWVMEYFPGYEQEYGGWIYVVEFRADNTVRAWFEGSTFVNPESMAVESDYEVKFSTGPMLTFNTFNEYLHYFDYPGTNGGYQSYRGDHEFSLMSMSGNYDEIMMRGLKSHNAIRMTPLPEGYTPERYIGYVRESQKSVPQTTLRVLANGRQVAVMTRENLFSEDSFESYWQSKVWTISYDCMRQVMTDMGVPAVDASGNPVYEVQTVREQLSTIVFPDRSMRLYAPYVFKGNIVCDGEEIDYMDGESMQCFDRHVGATEDSDFFICSDSFIDFRLVP
ncbi:MAG: DUF4302 domain-containing protein [Bacteroidales bacterium]|nr:DUF4302 domain-containing protein [Bacteroidales bacterium]